MVVESSVFELFNKHEMIVVNTGSNRSSMRKFNNIFKLFCVQNGKHTEYAVCILSVCDGDTFK